MRWPDGEDLLGGALYAAGAIAAVSVAGLLFGLGAWVVRWGLGL